MKKSIISVAFTVIFVNLIITILDRSYTIREFIPLLTVISSKRFEIEAYDFFLLLSILLLRIVFVHYGINRAALRPLIYVFRPGNITELIALAVAGAVSHFCLFPWLVQFLSDPITTIMHSPDPVRKTVIFVLPFIWLLTLTLISRGPHEDMPQNNRSLPFPRW